MQISRFSPLPRETCVGQRFGWSCIATIRKFFRALSRELNLAPRNLEVLVRAQAAVAARHVRNASSRRTRSVRRDVRWRWTLNVLWTAA
jgi:hypothetical protein